MAGASPRARLLYADDVAGRRVVIASTADASGASGTLVRMWTGPRGATATDLLATGLVRDRVTFVDDVVPVAVDAGPDDEEGAGAVVLLARPTVLEASYSPTVSYARDGGVGRRWTEVALRDGVATVPLRGPMPPAFRVRVDGFDGGPLGVTPLGLPVPDPSTPLATSLLDALGPFVAACTGLPASWVRSTVVLEAPVPGDVLVPAEQGEQAGRGLVVVAHSELPSGALLRTVRVVGGGPAGVGPVDVETTRAIASTETPSPFATRLPGLPQRREPVPRGRARRRPRPAGGHGIQHLPGVRGHRTAGRHRGARGRRCATSGPLPARHLGRTGPPARRLGGAVPPARPARPLAAGSLRVSGPGSRPRQRRRRRPRGRGTRPDRSA